MRPYHVLFKRTNLVPREAFNDVAERSKIDKLSKLGVKAPCDGSPRLTTLFDCGGQSVSVRTHGSMQQATLLEEQSECR